jgi:hypothetical protein
MQYFVPGKHASPLAFHAYIMDGVCRWNEDRARDALVGPNKPPPLILSYDTNLKALVNKYSQNIFGQELVPDVPEISADTGMLNLKKKLFTYITLHIVTLFCIL